MKRTLVIIGTIVVLVLCLSSCVTTGDFEAGIENLYGDYEYEYLIPGRKLSANLKLPNLDVEYLDIFTSEDSTFGSNANIYYTLFERECVNNIIEWDENESLGSIVLVPVYKGTKSEGLSFDIRILNVNNKVIWSQPYSGDVEMIAKNNRGVTKYGDSLLVFKALLDRAKSDLTNDYDLIVEKLRKAATSQDN